MMKKAGAKIKSILSRETEIEQDLYFPSKEEEELLEKLNAIIDSCKVARNKKVNIWDQAHAFIHEGIHWEQPKPSGMSDYSGNILFANVRHKAALVTDSRPMYNIVPMRELPAIYKGDDGEDIVVTGDVVNQLKSLIEDYGWYHWGLEHIVESACIDAFTYGTGIVKVPWDKNIDYPFGDVAPYRVSPYCFYVLPRTGESLQDAEGCIEARVMRVDEIEQMFPDRGKYVRADDDFSEIRYDKETESNDAEGYTIKNFIGNPDSSHTYTYTKDRYSGSKYAIPLAMVYEVYLKDNETTTYQEPVVDEMGNPVIDPITGEIEYETVTKKKYPRGRLVIFSNSVILYDGENPNKDGKFPYASFNSYSIPGQFWGVGEYEAHHKSQRAWNRLMCQYIDHYNGSNAKWIVEQGALDKNKKITGRPWEIITKRRGFEIKMEVPPGLPQDYFMMLSQFRQMIDLESGIHDVSRGEKTPGLDKVGIALTLKESDFTRMRPVIRGFERFISEIGEMCISRIIQFNRLNRKYSYIDQNTGEPVTLNISGLPDDIDLTFKVTVKSNSTLPADKPSRAATAMQLFNMGVIGPQALLKAIDWPNIQETLQESAMIQNMNSQIQQGQAAQEQSEGEIKRLTTENNELENRERAAINNAQAEKVRSIVDRVKYESRDKEANPNEGASKK